MLGLYNASGKRKYFKPERDNLSKHQVHNLKLLKPFFTWGASTENRFYDCFITV